MLANRNRRYMRLLLAATPLVVILYCVGFSAEPDASLESEILATFEKHKWDNGQYGFSGTTAEEFAAKYGPPAIPVLIRLIRQDEASTYLKGMAAFYLGKMPKAEGEKEHPVVIPLIVFIEQNARKPIGKAEFSAFYGAFCGLGFTGDAAALQYLSEAATEAYWWRFRLRFVRDSHERRKKARTLKDLRRKALLGIGYSGTKEAHRILKRLKSKGAKDLRSDVKDMLKENRKRMTGEHLEERKRSKLMP